jgi:hypothetical protein
MEKRVECFCVFKCKNEIAFPVQTDEIMGITLGFSHTLNCVLIGLEMAMYGLS